MVEGGGQALGCQGGQRWAKGGVGGTGFGPWRTFNARSKVAFSSGVRSSSALPRERCGIET